MKTISPEEKQIVSAALEASRRPGPMRRAPIFLSSVAVMLLCLRDMRTIVDLVGFLLEIAIIFALSLDLLAWRRQEVRVREAKVAWMSLTNAELS